jgi:hypothetical protein
MFYASQLILLLIGCAAGFLMLLTVQPPAPDQSAPKSPTTSRTLLALIIAGSLMALLLNFFEHMRVDAEVTLQNQERREALASLQKQVNDMAVVVSEAQAYQRNSREFLKDHELIQRNTLAQLATAINTVRGGAPGAPVASSTTIARPPASAPPVEAVSAPARPALPSSATIVPGNANEKRLLTEIQAMEKERDELLAQRETYRRNYEANRVNERDSERALALARTFSEYTAYMDQRIQTQNNKIARRITELKALRGQP